MDATGAKNEEPTDCLSLPGLKSLAATRKLKWTRTGAIPTGTVEAIVCILLPVLDGDRPEDRAVSPDFFSDGREIHVHRFAVPADPPECPSY